MGQAIHRSNAQGPGRDFYRYQKESTDDCRTRNEEERGEIARSTAERESHCRRAQRPCRNRVRSSQKVTGKTPYDLVTQSRSKAIDWKFDLVALMNTRSSASSAVRRALP